MAISRKRSSIVRTLKDEGLTNTEIEQKLGLSASSVRRYLRNSKQNDRPNILLLDIETSTVWSRVWGLWKQRIPYENVIRDWFMICFAYQWLGEDKTHGDCVTRKEALRRDDSRVTYSAWKVLNNADLVIGHNLNRFDLRKIMARFIEHGLPKPKPYRTLDTLTQSRKHFAFSAHNLDYLNSIFSLRMKEDTDYDLWISCEGWEVNKDYSETNIYPFRPIPAEQHTEALEYMYHYCNSDVKALEDLYIRLRPYMTSHPNLGLYVDDVDPMCPHCYSKDLIEDGVYTSNVSVFRAYRCLKCGATPRGRKTLLSKEKREGLLVSTAR